MNVDIEIYLSNVQKFFKNNPKDLLNLVPKSKEQDFYKKIKEIAELNLVEGRDIVLTQKQLVEVCVELNGKSKKIEDFDPRVFIDSPYGKICLN